MEKKRFDFGHATWFSSGLTFAVCLCFATYYAASRMVHDSWVRKLSDYVVVALAVVLAFSVVRAVYILLRQMMGEKESGFYWACLSVAYPGMVLSAILLYNAVFFELVLTH